ncbi:MAG: hypothetical protein IRZ04_10475 [Rhodospirillales bacterium]|nr:hypothetical protein [Rhodospirillales bacterium]
MNGAALPQRVIDPDGHAVETFPLPTDEAVLAPLLRDLFQDHWHEIVFGPIIEGAAWEWRAPHAPTRLGLQDGYLTVAFGAAHFHLCIGPTKGPRGDPTPPALAEHRRCARAELFRRLDRAGAPNSWGLRLYNGAGEQQVTVFFPNPFLSDDGERVRAAPDWSRLALWDAMRARLLGALEPDPFDRSAKAFHHG